MTYDPKGGASLQRKRRTAFTVGLTVRGKVVRLFSAAIIDQVILSGTRLLVGLLLVRYTADRDYALYVMLQSALALVISLHGGIVCGPLSILAPKKEPESRREMIAAVRASQNRMLWPLVLILLLACGLGYVSGLMSATLALVCGVGVIAAWTAVLLNFGRNALLMYSRLRMLVVIDIVYVGVLLAGVLWASFGSAVPIIWVAVALAAASWISSIGANRVLAPDIGRAGADARPMWREMHGLGFWYVMAIIIFWLYSQSYSYVLASRLSLTAVANVNAVRLMVVPAMLISTGLQGVLTPAAAAWLAEIGFDGMVRRLLALAFLVVLCSIAYLSLTWVFRDWLSVHVLHKRIPDRDYLLLLWVVLAVINVVRDVLGPAINALGKLKWVAWQSGACAVIAILTMWFGIPVWGARAVLIALIAAETLNLAGILHLIRQQQKRSRVMAAPAG